MSIIVSGGGTILKPVLIKNWVINSTHAQMIMIIIVFLLMGITCFLIAVFLENSHLKKEAENALVFAEAEFDSDIQEPESFLIGYSETIRGMIFAGYNDDTISQYMADITSYFTNSGERMSGLITTYGYFFNWSKLLSGTDRIPTDSLNAADNQLYTTALKAQGETVITGPYRDTITYEYYISMSHLIRDNNNEPLAVIGLDININRFHKHSVNNMTRNSFGVLLNENLTLIAYPALNYAGLTLNQQRGDLGLLYSELKHGDNIYNRRIKISRNDSIIYFIKIRFGWFIGIVIPENEYYRSLNYTAVFLLFFCSLFAWALCTLFSYINKEKINADKRTQQKSNFLATMSHEIRTPLNTILGMTEIQMQSSAHPSSTIDAFLKINNSGKLLLNIINDILDLSKIESGKLELVPVKYEVASLINDIIQLNYIRYEYKPIEFKIEIDENTPSVLIGDELRIKQILNNLLSNSFKYTDKGEITLSVSAECVGRGGGAVLVTLIFQIKDTGHGMTQEQVSKLFDENTRFNLEANRTTEGAGLGMTITQNLIELMYGKINVKSTVGEGTVVNIRLPQKTDGAGIRGVIGKEMAENLQQFRVTGSVQSSKVKISHEYMPYGRILIVDDVETNLYVAKGLMAPYGLKIDLATSGFEAIDKVKEGIIYDIIFMDHMMPKMDGMETTRLIREMGYTFPVVALTANAIMGQADIFIKNGFDDFLSKPIDLRQLNILLNRLIRDKQPKEVIEAAYREKEELKKKGILGQKQQQVDSQLAEIFARDAEKAIKVLETCIQSNLNNENDIHLYIVNIHAMKSALANIGETELSAIALRLEQEGRDKNINAIMSETGDFLDILKKVIMEIKLKNANNEASDDTEDSLILLHEKLEIIKEACTMFDKKTAKNIMNELREKTWSHKPKELLNSISEHLLHSEFEEISALIEQFWK